VLNYFCYVPGSLRIWKVLLFLEKKKQKGIRIWWVLLSLENNTRAEESGLVFFSS
jgi:hypothetical protein